MGITATLVVRARFIDRAQADRIARYLPEEGRAALIDDVDERDQQAYAVIEELEYALVTRVDANTLCCSFDFCGVDDFDEEAPRVLARFRELGAVDVLGAVIADEDDRLYVMNNDGTCALLLLDAARAAAIRETDDATIFNTMDQALATPVTHSPGTRWDAPSSPAEPLLVPLELDAAEDDCDGDD